MSTTELACIRTALEAVRAVDNNDPDKQMVEIALQRIIAKKNVTNKEKLALAQRHMAELDGASKRRAIAQRVSEAIEEGLELRFDGYSSKFVREFDDMVRNNIDPTRSVLATSIESRRQALTNKYLGRLAEMFEDYFIGIVNIRPKDTTNLSRELLGVNTGDAIAARAVAKYREVYRELAARLRKTGVFVQELKDYHPQRLSPGRLGESKEEALRDLAAMLDPEFHPDPVESAQVIYTTYMTRHTLEPGDQPLTMGRKVHYRTDEPDALVAFLQKYGEDDVIKQIERQVRQMTRALAATEVLGPDPGGVINRVLRKFVRNADEGSRKEVEGRARAVKNAWDQISGTAETPDNPTFANWFSGMRSAMTSMMLGKVGLAIVTMDSLIAPLQRARVEGFGRAFSLQAQGTMAMFSRDMRNRIRDLYQTIEPAYFMGSPNSRFSPDPTAEGFARTMQHVGSGFYRAAGAWDAEQMLRGASSFSMGKSMGYAYKTPWDELEPSLQQDFAAGGITKQVWDEVNRSGRVDNAGLFVWDEMPVQAGEAVGAWFHKTLSQTVLRPDATTQAWLMAGGRRGTLPGEVSLLLTQFLNWPIAFARIAMQQQYKKGAPQFAIFGGAMLTASVVTEQLYQIAGGSPAYEWDSPDLWTAGLSRSGLLTPIGDWAWAYATGDEMRQPGLGPLVDTTGNILGATGRSIKDLMNDDTDAAAAEIIRLTKRLAPNTFWFEMSVLNPAMESAMEALDPSYLSQRESRFIREERQGY